MGYETVMRTRMLQIALCAGVGIAATSMVACDRVQNVSGVYLEVLHEETGSEDRSHALRITAFEYQDLVGGWVEYYQLDGFNTLEDPFIEPTSCTYFGPYRRTTTGFVVRAPGVSENKDLQIRLSTTGRRSFIAVMEQDGGVFWPEIDGQGRALLFEKDSREADESCPAGVPLIDRPLLVDKQLDVEVTSIEVWP